VINSNMLAQVNDAAGLVHPAAASMTFTTGPSKAATALYSGDTIGITLAAAGGAYIDQASLMKWVDASVKNGCDAPAAGASNTAAERLAGHKSVRGTAHALITAGGGCTVTTTNAAGVANSQATTAFSGQGRNACQTAGGAYVDPTTFSVGFAYADLTTNTMGVAPDAMAPTTAWRLCMVSLCDLGPPVGVSRLLCVCAYCIVLYWWYSHRTPRLPSGTRAR
jgi:hypothetical protein